jgi:hypothetical protein
MPIRKGVVVLVVAVAVSAALVGFSAQEPASPTVSFTAPGDGSHAFVELGATRSSVHFDLPGGTRAYVVIPARHGFTQPDVMVLTPVEAEVGGRDETGVEIDLELARYRVFDRAMYIVFDRSGGATLARLQRDEPLAPFFLPMSGHFNPFMAALIKGIPFERVLRDDVGVVMPMEDDQGRVSLQVLPAIAVGYDDLIVARISEPGVYVPLPLDRAGLRPILAAQTQNEGLPPLDQMRVLAAERTLTTGRPDAERVALAREQLVSFLVSGATSVSSTPSEAVTAAALARLWAGEGLTAARPGMVDALVESIQYWKDYRKDGDRFDVDTLVALMTLTAESVETLGRRPASPVGSAVPAIQDEIRRVLQPPPPTEDDEPLRARDVYAAGLVAALMGDRAAAERHTLTARQMFREQLGRMADARLTPTTIYQALVWGRLIGADQNPHRYRAMYDRYERARMRYEKCEKSRRRLILRSYGLADFADQQKHTLTYIEAVRSGILNCGRRPAPPRYREKPELGALGTAEDGMRRFGRMTSAPRELAELATMEKTMRGLRSLVGGKVRGLLPDPGTIVLERLLDDNFRRWADAHRALAQDPPRDDYKLLAEPGEAVLPAALTDERFSEDARQLAVTVLDTTALLEAAIVTFDRLGGALRAGDADWVRQQEVHLEHLKHDIGAATLEVVDALQAVSDFLADVELSELEDPALEASAARFIESALAMLWDLLEALGPLGEVLVDSY